MCVGAHRNGESQLLGARVWTPLVQSADTSSPQSDEEAALPHHRNPQGGGFHRTRVPRSSCTHHG